MSGCDAIVRAERVGSCDPLTVDEGAVLAIQIPHCPVLATPFDNQVLAGKSGILGIAQLVAAGSAERVAVTVQLKGASFSVRGMDQQLAGLECLDSSGH